MESQASSFHCASPSAFRLRPSTFRFLPSAGCLLLSAIDVLTGPNPTTISVAESVTFAFALPFSLTVTNAGHGAASVGRGHSIPWLTIGSCPRDCPRCRWCDVVWNGRWARKVRWTPNSSH